MADGAVDGEDRIVRPRRPRSTASSTRVTARSGLTADTSFAPSASQNNFDIERSYLNVRSKSEGGITTRVTVAVDGRRAAASQLSIRRP